MTEASSLREFLAARDQFTVEEHRVAGRRIRVRRTAARTATSNPPIVLLPGLALSGHYVLPVGARLGRRFDVYVPDLPDHVRRSTPRAALDMPELADVVVGWMDWLGLGPAALVANSMGCQVAVEAAARHPARVSQVVLEGPTIDAQARSVIRQAGRLIAAGRREPPSLGPLQLMDWATTGPRTVIGTIRHTFAHRIEDVLNDVACPALVVRGELDAIVPQAWAERVAHALPRGSLVTARGAGHAMTYSAPGQLAALVEGFLAGSGSR